MELIVNGKNAWLNYLVMSNELSTPKILHCPADLNTFAAANFSNFSNQNISYFVGLNASEKFPQTMLAGDDNFEITDLFEIIGNPVKAGLLEISGRASVAWTAARHRFVGNILMTDGSVKTINISTLNNLSHIVTNRLAIP